jgi:hypothetical protein
MYLFLDNIGFRHFGVDFFWLRDICHLVHTRDSKRKVQALPKTGESYYIFQKVNIQKLSYNAKGRGGS